MRTALIFALALPLGLVACGDSSTATPDAAAGDTTTTPDTTETGDTAGGGDTTETPAVECVVDDDCAASGTICDCRGACVVPSGAACTEDRNCGIPFWCDDCTKHCAPQVGLCESCVNSRGCVEGGACMPYAAGGTHCGRPCISDAGCAIGYACVEVGGVADKQCVARSGSCVDLGVCEADADCPDLQICQAQLGECAPGCVEDGGCAGDLVCQLGRCVEPCTGDGDCTAPAECADDGKCRIPGACEVKADCPEPETYCDRTTGMCADGCLIDTDCGDAAKKCSGRACVARGCEHNFECQFNHVCDQSTGACVESTEPHCAACGDSGSYACPEPELCVTFQDEDENPLGDHCLLPCADDPIDQCPSGYQCQAIEIDGQPSYYCTRQCYVDPVGGSSAQ